MSVEASLVVSFSDEEAEASNSPVSLELDPEHDDNQEDGEAKSTFDMDDEPIILLAYDSSVYTFNSIEVSSGDISEIDTDISQTREETLTFGQTDDTVNLSYPNTSGLSVSWYGNNGTVSLSDNIVTATGGDLPCVGEAEYSVNFNKQYRLLPSIPSGETSYKILVFVSLGSV